MNWLDAIILLPLLLGLIRGFMKGLIREVMAVLAIILGCIGARMWGPAVAAWCHSHWQWPDAVCMACAYALLFIAIAIVMSIVAKLLSRLFSAVNLSGFNRLLGAVFGLAEYGVIVLLLIFCIDNLDKQLQFMPSDVVASSVLYHKALEMANQLLVSVTGAL